MSLKTKLVNNLLYLMEHPASNSRFYFVKSKKEIPGIDKHHGYIRNMSEFKNYIENLSDDDFVEVYTGIAMNSVRGR